MADGTIIKRELVGFRVTVTRIEDREIVEQEWKRVRDDQDAKYVDKVTRKVDESVVVFDQVFSTDGFDLKRLVAAANGIGLTE